MIIAVVWQSPIRIDDAKELVKTLPNSYMLQQFQEQRDQYFNYYQQQKHGYNKHKSFGFKSLHRQTSDPNKMSPTYNRHGSMSYMQIQILYLQHIINIDSMDIKLNQQRQNQHHKKLYISKNHKKLMIVRYCLGQRS